MEEVGPYLVDIRHPLGGGSFGAVFAAVDKASGDRVTVRPVHNFDLATTESAVDELLPLSHPNILRLLATFGDLDTVYLVSLPCQDHLPLCDFLTDVRPDLDVKIGLMDEASAAIAFLHDQHPDPLVHRNIRPQTLLITGRDRPSLKVADIGITRLLERHGLTGEALFGALSPWSPPEAFEDPVAFSGPPVDVFSLGLVFLDMILAEKEGRAMGDFLGEAPGPDGPFLGSEMLEVHQAGNSMTPAGLLVTWLDTPQLCRLKALIFRMTCFYPPSRLPAAQVGRVLRLLRSMGPQGI